MQRSSSWSGAGGLIDVIIEDLMLDGGKTVKNGSGRGRLTPILPNRTGYYS